MADKQIDRPSGLIPSWANDVNISDPGEPWDATPTKVEPGAAQRDTGFVPADKPAAQHVNFLLNNYAKWLQYLGDVGQLNWRAEDAGGLTKALSCCYDRGQDVFVVGGDGSVSESAAGGTWTDSAAPTNVDLDCLASKPPTDAPTHTGRAYLAAGAATNALQIRTSGGWNSQTAAGFAISTCSIWDPIGQRWIVGGSDGSGDARFVTAAHAAAPSWGVITPPTATGGIVRAMAHNDAGLIVAVGAGIGDAWTSTDGGASWTYRATGSAASHQTIAYDPALSLFVALAGAEVLTTADGVLWTSITTISKNFGLSATSARGHKLLRIVGGLWIASVSGAIAASTDQGATWREIPADLVAGGGVPYSIDYSPRHRKFIAVQGVAVARVLFSLAVGTPDTSTEGISAPQV